MHFILYYGMVHVVCMQCGRVLQPLETKEKSRSLSHSLLHIGVVFTQCYMELAGWVTFACNIHRVRYSARGHKSTWLWEMIIPRAEEIWIVIKGIIKRMSSCMTVGTITLAEDISSRQNPRSFGPHPLSLLNILIPIWFIIIGIKTAFPFLST